MSFNKSKYIILIVLAILMLSSCNSKNNEEEGVTEIIEEKVSNTITFTKEQYQLAGIKTGRVTQKNLSSVIKLNGKIEVDPTNKAVVSAQLGGYIKSAGLIVGTPVKKGQVLAIIENVEFITIQQEYLESIGELQFLEEEFKRQKELREQDINSKKTFQKVTSEYKMLKAKVNGLEQKLALIGINKHNVQAGTISRTASLFAPINGYIKSSNATIGDYVAPTDEVFEIVNTDKIQLELNVYESNLSYLSIGQKVRFSLANETGFNRLAVIQQIGKASGNDRVIIARCTIDKESTSNLLPEMYVKANVESNPTEQQVIPSDAIVQFNNKNYLIIENGKSNDIINFNLLEIKKGIEQDGFIAIESSEKELKDSESIVVENAYAVISLLRNSLEGEEE
ncbi:efflux RND transporter periplasmic adaptor subunit [uncultured Flavobacterium sp.]|uniref:efflux RND transporter periplasmic adaptor subunit n=1 Tax=uncultured Flavobacterium sp. TaxID=165435 RepID=UPI0025FC7F9B|nr:efflux RND transporter periplasmic adaptor subunit [uncultured Flavobacterium sp.]